jgi:hypothetical protein
VSNIRNAKKSSYEGSVDKYVQRLLNIDWWIKHEMNSLTGNICFVFRAKNHKCLKSLWIESTIAQNTWNQKKTQKLLWISILEENIWDQEINISLITENK